MTQKYIDKILVISIILILIIIIILLLIKNYGKNIKESFHNFTGYRYYKNNDLYNRLRNYYYTNPQYYDHRYIIDRYPSTIHSTHLVDSNNLYNHTCNNQYECPNMLRYPERSYPLTYPHLVSYYI